MKKLYFLDEEKNRVLEMHSGKKSVIFEQSVGVPYGTKKHKLPIDTKLWKMLEDELTGEGPSIIKETPNQLIIDGLSGTWTITLTK
jgi:hypothetical protein